jgi:predicted nucleic acid-binding Zn ribbon protein
VACKKAYRRKADCVVCGANFETGSLDKRTCGRGCRDRLLDLRRAVSTEVLADFLAKRPAPLPVITVAVFDLILTAA